MARQSALINPDLLVWAREQTGLDEAAAAKRLRVDPEQLHSWERGDLLPTVGQAQRAARVYRRPLGAFYLATRPPPDSFPTDFRRLPGEHVDEPSPELRLAIRTARVRRRAAIESLQLQAQTVSWIGSLPATSSDALGAAVRRLTQVDLEQQRRWAGEYEPLNRWRDTVERAGVLVFHFSRVATEEARGFSLADRPFPVIALNGSDVANARTFTLMHELAHLFVGEAGACNLREGTGPTESHLRRIEILCNAAAAEALVPSDALLAEELVAIHGRSPIWLDLEIRHLARDFGVSREVILRRLLTLERTTEEFYRRKRDEWASAPRRTGGGPMSQAQLAIRNTGKRYARSVLDSYASERITGPEASRLLGIKLKHLPDLDRRLSGTNVLTGGDR